MTAASGRTDGTASSSTVSTVEDCEIGTGPTTMHLTFAILMSQASNYTQGLNSNGRGNGFFSCHLEHRHSKQILLRWLSKHLHSITAHMGLWDSDTSALFPGRAGTFDAVEINSLWFIYNKKGRKIHTFLFQAGEFSTKAAAARPSGNSVKQQRTAQANTSQMERDINW